MPLDIARQIVARPDPDARYAALLREIGATMLAEEDLRDVDQGGLWPGITRSPASNGRGDETASASRDPWIDANGYRVAWLRALHPQRPPVLGYVPKTSERMVPFDSLELALIESWTSGGNYILTLEPRFREALFRGDASAKTAWRQLGSTAQWLRANGALFGQPVMPVVTLLVEPGEATAEIANLMYRRNVSPALEPASNPPRPDPERRLVLVAVDLAAPPPAPVRDRILAHATAGATVVVNGAWWRNRSLKPLRSEEDRDHFSLGRGRVIAYKDAIADPSEFAMDAIDFATQKRRAVRLWNAQSTVAVATQGLRDGNGAKIIAINYGSPARGEIQARIQGVYAKATLLRPEGKPLPLKAARRGTTTEVFITELRRLAVVVFE